MASTQRISESGSTAAAVDAVHRANLVHRDIKPTNLLVDPHGRVVLVDFGLALGSAELDTTRSGNASLSGEHTCRTRMTRSNMVVGTTNYMSPEQLLGRDVDARSDVFSLGVTAYEALFGVRPFAANTAYELAVAYDAGERPDPPGGKVPRWVTRALLGALELDPARRTATAAQFAAALMTPPWRRSPLASLAVLGALMGAGAGAAWWAQVDGPAAAPAEAVEAAETAAEP